MLTIEPARRRRMGSGRIGVALAGGGPLGAFYELGTLHALAEALGRDLTDFDVYVGVSSGSLLAAGLANGFDTTSLGRTFIYDEGTLLPFSPELFLRPAIGEYGRRLARWPAALASALRQYARNPAAGGWQPVLGAVAKLAPTTVFDNRQLEGYLHEAFSSPGHTDDFRRLRARLYIVATRLSTGESVVFGAPGYDHVAISRAAVASAALPGLYPAVEIDGRHYVDGALLRTMHASLALEASCELVICINPLVPYDSSGTRGRGYSNLADEGLAAILAQTFRAFIHSRMQVGMTSYRARFPQADTLLFEPERRDEMLFHTNLFAYSGRGQLVDHAYQQTRRDLLAQADALAPVLARHGLRLDTGVLRQNRRSFASAVRERAEHSRGACRRLDRALLRLEHLVGLEDRGS